MKHLFEMRMRRPCSIHMPKMIAFTIFSTRWQEEITRIRWEDLDDSRQAVLVRDMRNSRQKMGNDVWCRLPDEACAILKTMPKSGKEIFPYKAKSVSGCFMRACPLLGIEDLHFHDLRHEGVSRLSEMDWDIPRVSSVSGHSDWNSLRLYTHLRGRGICIRVDSGKIAISKGDEIFQLFWLDGSLLAVGKISMFSAL